MSIHCKCNIICKNGRKIWFKKNDNLRIMVNCNQSCSKEELRQEVSTQQIYRVRQRAKKANEGSWVKQYNKLGQCVEVLKEFNPGSTIVLKTQMRGNIFLIAYVIVDIENQNTWESFIEILKEDLGMENSHGYAFITDKQKGLGNAIQSLMPNEEHGHCLRHLCNNFKKKHIGLALKQTLWDAARSTSIPWWQAIMEKLTNKDLEAYKWLNTKPANNWSMSHFKEEFKCDILQNNLCEAFHGAITKVKDKPILIMLRVIMKDLIFRMANRRLPGDALAKMDLCGIPCAHAMTCIPRKHQDPHIYVGDCYKQATYLRAYSPIITPTLTPDQWPNHFKSPLNRGRPWSF
ncbi:hypothetical protein D8674_024497 [Pyrus ussuriensis x Pyrus communis]|uniref:MULE transposase domain-containing protein n=1 Tax=Pyrus ussuriensis x Pyrus communis TaxID=2448454 RepID=A0A5N5H328_9ROSA|nr:hypothetical protein D8674_024497 [Pyrus ussuriensis x Pyrus communis]